MNVEDIIAFTKGELSDFKDWAHSFSHIAAVLALLDDFLMNVSPEGVNGDALYIAATLHDIGRIHGAANHAANSAGVVDSLPLEHKNLVREIVLEHDYPKKKAHEIRTVEAQILWDLDNLDSNGYIGLIRVQEYAKFLGKDLAWAMAEFESVWRAKPEHMHFDYTRRLMETKKAEEERYLPLIV